MAEVFDFAETFLELPFGEVLPLFLFDDISPIWEIRFFLCAYALMVVKTNEMALFCERGYGICCVKTSLYTYKYAYQ